VSSRITLAVAVAIAAAALLPGAAVSRSGGLVDLVGTVGPGFTITLRTAGGARVTHLAAGTYTITVNDQATEHNFHLFGPGVDRATGVDFVGSETWTVTLSDGTYTYQCDPHQATLKGSFTVGSVQPPPPPPPPTSAKAKRLNATVGPGFAISLRTPAGKRAARVKAGKYRITVRDRSKAHNFHLVGPGVNKSTGVRFRGKKTWTVTFRKGKTYRFRCDPHRSRMHGAVRAT
jgi:plastocyanin